MNGRKSKKDHSGDTRQKILNAAAELFNEFGYDEASIPMICERAGVSKTTLHYYFPKKQDLFIDMKNNFEELYAENFHRIVEQETFTKQIWEVFNIMCEGDIFYGVGVTQRYFLGRIKEHTQRDFIKTIYHKKMLTAVIRAAQNAKQMRNLSDPETLAEALSFAMRGIILTWAIEDGTLDLFAEARAKISAIIDPMPGFEI